MLYQASKKSQNWQIPFAAPIDMVITWANLTDPTWRTNYEKYVRKIPERRRHCQFGELELSLASITKYMPWLRTIYLITECKVPDYVNENRKVKVIHSNEILDIEALKPTFNSNVIEAYMHRIPGLSECFLWGNDDFFVGQPISKSEWFRNGVPLVTMRPRYLAYPITDFEWSIYNAIKLAASFTGDEPPSNPTLLAKPGWGGTVKSQTHQISVLRKSACQMVWKLFPEFMMRLVTCRIRKPDDQQLQFHLLAALIGIHVGSMKLQMETFNGYSLKFYDETSPVLLKKHLLKLLLQPPRLYCINEIKPDERKMFREFKEKMLFNIKMMK